ncbi:endolytic transglycosylase MltG [Kitasatospora mediocidica]|uniref:endolytic transglycosylase MltG n=1 Tax=Kitasatospora mediocidica TaxID=58352 RepID=UPI0006916736|nr:endolytic transglycosylase MltG [Kitasatospora mediocidica]
MDQDSAPGLTPGHLGAPALEPGPQERPPAPSGPRDQRPDRTGLACGLTALLLALLAGGVLLIGVRMFGHSGPPQAADYQGGGTGSVEISVPQGASLTRIGQLLVKNKVVASTKAFTTVAAQATGQRIQPGTYTLKRQMSAAAALTVLGNPANANGLTVPEGWRASQIYAAIDQRLKLPSGSAQYAADQHRDELGLPDYAGGNPEGLYFPSTYSVTSDSTPLSLLQQMVKQSGVESGTDELDADAPGNGITSYQALVMASLVQGEADNPDDMAKVARVIYNRLGKGMPLQLDSTINYALGRTTLHTTVTDTKLDSPFNTYQHPGLPPTPIDSPGHDALDAVLNPAQGDWLYFVTVQPGDTRFTDSEQQHKKNVDDFNAYQAQHAPSPGASPS